MSKYQEEIEMLTLDSLINLRESFVEMPYGYNESLSKVEDCSILMAEESLPFDIREGFSMETITNIWIIGTFDMFIENGFATVNASYKGIDEKLQRMIAIINRCIDDEDFDIDTTIAMDTINSILSNPNRPNTNRSIDVKDLYDLTLIHAPIPKATRFTQKEYDVFKDSTKEETALELIYAMGMVNHMTTHNAVEGQSPYNLSKQGIKLFRYVHHNLERLKPDMDMVFGFINEILNGTLWNEVENS